MFSRFGDVRNRTVFRVSGQAAASGKCPSVPKVYQVTEYSVDLANFKGVN